MKQCAFLNTAGGYIFLGIDDDKNIIGIDNSIKDKLKKDFSSLCNNKEIISPTVILSLNEIVIDNKLVLYTYVAEANDIHKTKGKYFIRNYEGDFDISNNVALISSIYRKKQKLFDEDEIYPDVSMENDLRSDLIEKARKLANHNVNKEHPWIEMNDLELLKSANLYKTDKTTGTSGVTLAGIMLFGKDDVIKRINPYCRTDALLRIDDTERYDDRDFIQTNLLDMYDRLLDFIGKYTMDRFALSNDGKMRISPRGIMAREMVINSLMHRDITDGHTSKIVIYKDKIVSKNPNGFRTYKNITLENYEPFTKNPTLASFFREIGRADELGSGIKKITENSLKYSGKMPIFEDKETFTLTIPLLRDKKVEEGARPFKTGKKLSDTQREIIKIINKDGTITQKEISNVTNIPLRTVKRNISYLSDEGILERNGSRKNGVWLVCEKDEDY